jgi:hypothetical protein
MTQQVSSSAARGLAGRQQLSLLLLTVAAAAAVAVTLLGGPLGAAAYPSGAPESACKDLKPSHGVEAASGAAPFELTQDKLQVEAGDQIKGKYMGAQESRSGAKTAGGDERRPTSRARLRTVASHLLR